MRNAVTNNLRTPLQLEVLEDRFLPSATVIDLTTRGAQAQVGEAIFRQTDAQPTGTGAIDSFVRLQGRGSATVEQGFNTSARPLQYDENSSPQFTRSLRLSEVPQVTLDGKVYLEFLLDINQSANQPLLSLDELRLYIADEADLTGYNPETKELAGHTAVFDLDATEDNYLKLNYRLNRGSGSGDVFFYVPLPMSVRSGDPHLYLYSKFGENIAANAGFEEWAVRSNQKASLSGFVYFDEDQDGQFGAEESGIAGVTILLTGIDRFGKSVSLSVVTDENGFYSFGGLEAGTYRLHEIQPEGLADGEDSIGTQGGVVGDDEFYDIYLLRGQNGLFNNFGEILYKE